MKFIILFFLAFELYSAYYHFSNDILLNNTEVIIPLLNETNQNLIFLTGNYTATYIYWLFYKYNGYSEEAKDCSRSDYKYRIKNIDIILAGNKLQYYFFYQYVKALDRHRICLVQIEHSKEENLACIDGDNSFIGTLKNLNSNYFLISKDNEIIKIETTFNFSESENMFKLSKKQFYEKDEKIISVSCDICKNNECYICSYFINENNYGISSYSNEFSLFYKKQYDSGTTNQDNYFNKIVYFKDNISFITIHSINKDTIRLRYFDSNKNSLINKLNIKNVKSDYLDIKNTQINPYHDTNDIAVLGTDKIIKAFCDENKIIISIIQFYNKDESVLTLKTFNTDLPAKSPKLLIWENKIVLSLIYQETGNVNYNSSRFFIFGNPNLRYKTNSINKNINTNNNIKINIFAIEDDLIFSNIFTFCKISNIPKDFVFTDLIDKAEITNGKMLEVQSNEIVFKQYKKNINAILTIQAMMVGDFKNNTFEIFPSNSVIPNEDKIIQEGIKIDLNINIKECNNGYYEIEYEYDICTNTRPEGYYLDKENNIFKKCNQKCSECFTGSDDDSNMMCLKCINGYTYDPKTFNCIAKNYDKNEININVEPEKNVYFWFFIAIILISLVIIFFSIILPWCRKDKKTYLNGINETDNLIPDEEMKKIN